MQWPGGQGEKWSPAGTSLWPTERGTATQDTSLSLLLAHTHTHTGTALDSIRGWTARGEIVAALTLVLMAGTGRLMFQPCSGARH